VNTAASHHGHKDYFGALDGFRGVLALCVAIHHANWFSYVNYRSFINEGFVIIDLFFAFSGFLMFRLYAEKLSNTAQCGEFMRRRFARLYPIHLFMVFIFLAYAIARVLVHKVGIATLEPGEVLPFSPGAQEGWLSLFTNLALLHSMGIHDSLSFNFPSWTISVEFFTYFVFMAMMLWAPPKKSWHFALMAGMIGLIYFGLSRIKPNMDITYDFGFLRCMGGFFTGVLTAWVYNNLLQRRAVSGQVLPVGLISVIEALTVFISLLFVIYCTGKDQFFVAPILFFFVLVFAFDGGYISHFMSLPVFRYLAKISYSVYMTHAIFAIVFAVVGLHLFPGYLSPGPEGTGLAGDLYMIPYLATVIVFSHMTYKYVEVPGGRFLRKLDWPWQNKKPVKTG